MFTDRIFPMYHRLKSPKKIYGQVLLDQTIALDLSACNVCNEDIIDEVSINELYQIIEHYKLLFSIDQLD